MAYLEWLPSIVPRWLQKGAGSKLLSAAGFFFDGLTEAAKQATRAPFPNYAPPDALEALGEESQTPRATIFEHEHDTDYGERLRLAFDHRVFLGTKTGLLAQLGRIGFSNHIVYDLNEWNPTAHWSHGWIVIQQPHPWLLRTWGQGTYADGTTWGSTASPSQVENFKACIRPWIHSGAKMWALIYLGGEIWGQGTWGSGTWGPGYIAEWKLFD